MAYENGEQVNRYRNLQIHKEHLKKNHLPSDFTSFEKFMQDRSTAVDELCRRFETYAYRTEQKKKNGDKDWWEKWWQHNCEKSSSLNRELKKYSNKAIRNGYKRFIKEIMKEEDFDDYDKVENIRRDGPADPWFWF